MYARVARWEGATADQLREMSRRIAEADGPPPGVPAAGITQLIDPEGGTAVTIVYFATEDDLRRGDEALGAMNPDPSFGGRRASVETFEVAVERRA